MSYLYLAAFLGAEAWLVLLHYETTVVCPNGKIKTGIWILSTWEGHPSRSSVWGMSDGCLVLNQSDFRYLRGGIIRAPAIYHFFLFPVTSKAASVIMWNSLIFCVMTLIISCFLWWSIFYYRSPHLTVDQSVGVSMAQKLRVDPWARKPFFKYKSWSSSKGTVNLNQTMRKKPPKKTLIYEKKKERLI